MIRDEEEIRKEEEKATDAYYKPSKYRAMTYEQGVCDALRWVLGDEEVAPLYEDEE